jgi:hypothetical protein
VLLALSLFASAWPAAAADERPGNKQEPGPEEKSDGRPKPKPAPKPAPPKPFPEPEGGLPAGTVRVRLTPGQTFALPVQGGTQVVCDDPAVVRAEFTADAIVLAAQAVGATLCGARFAGATKGLWYVVVEAK